MGTGNFTADAAAALPGPDWLRKRRLDAFDRFAGSDLPTEAEEVWRYSRIGDLDLDTFRPEASVPDGGEIVEDPGPRSAMQALVRDVLEALGEPSAVVVIRNGRIVSGDLANTGPGIGKAEGEGGAVRLWGLSELEAGDDELVDAAPDPFVELNRAMATEPVVIEIPAKQVAAPTVVVHWIDRQGLASFPRTVVRAGEGARGSLVEVVAGTDVSDLVVPVASLDVADSAQLSYLGLQMLGGRSWHLGYQLSRVGAKARLSSFTMALGGSYARVRTDSRLVGTGGTSNLFAAYFGTGDQMHDFRTMQDHSAPKTTSDLLFKGAVADTSRSVYTGLIRVRNGAAGTDAFQTNRNLVLSEGAHADSVPNLDIEENDVRCSHASAVGPIDEYQRYYLESRGVPPGVADRLIILGFFNDILIKAPSVPAQPYLRQIIVSKLAEAALDE